MPPTANFEFNPELFLNTNFDQGNATELLLIPEGEYIAVSQGIGVDNFRSFDISKGDRAGTKGYSLDIKWDVNDESGKLKEYLGRSPTVKQGIMLDMGMDGTLQFGKGRNVGLGLLREALNQNQTGRPWAFSMLGGQVAKIKVKHRLDTKSGQTFAEVAAVTKA